MPCSDETVMTEFWCDADLGFALTSQENVAEVALRGFAA